MFGLRLPFSFDMGADGGLNSAEMTGLTETLRPDADGVVPKVFEALDTNRDGILRLEELPQD